MKHRWSAVLIGGIAAIVFGQIASAADLPRKTPAYTPPPLLTHNWTGLYVGGNVGYGWGDNTSGSIAALDPASAIFLNPNYVFSPDQFTNAFRQNGGVIGGQVGFNWQVSPNWVGGLETDFQWSSIRGDASNVLFLNPENIGTIFPFTVSTERKLEWFGTVRGRLGYLVTPDLLIYATGGLAYGKTNMSGSIVNTPAAGINNLIYIIGDNGVIFTCGALGPAAATCYAGSGSKTSMGWVAGAGIEYHLIGNLTAKAEYLYIDLGGDTITLTSPPPSSPGVAVSYSFNREAINIVRLGVNYKFN
jgi:outer membrane immunogenic protein